MRNIAVYKIGMFAFFMIALVLLIYPRARMSLTIVGSGTYQVFFEGQAGFSEANSIWVGVPGEADKELHIRGLSPEADALRIDPASNDQRFSICSARKRVSWLPWLRSAPDGAARVLVAHELNPGPSPLPGCSAWQVTGEATDPQVVLDFPASVARDTEVLAHVKTVRNISVLLGMLCLVVVLRRTPARNFAVWGARSSSLYIYLDRRLPRLFLALALGLGFGYIITTPPGSVPDEQAHAAKIGRMAIGDWHGNDESGPFPQLVQGYGVFSDYLGVRRKFSVNDLQRVVAAPLDCRKTSYEPLMSPIAGSPLLYILPFAAYEATCASDGSFGLFYYAGRSLNLLLYAFLVYFGLRYAGMGRWAIFFGALLPMPLYLASSISYDSNALALAFCYFGVVSGVYSSNLPCRRAIVPLVLISCALAFSKPLIGWVFFTPLFCLPRCGEQKFNRATWLALCSILPGLLHLMWLLFISSGTVGSRPDVAAVNGLQSLQESPSDFIYTLWTTAGSDTGLNIARGVVGVFGWLDIYLQNSLYWMVLFSAGCAIALNGDRVGSRSMPGLMLALMLAITAIIVLALPFYAFWTVPGSPVIEGLQGRYLLPVVIFLAVLSSFKINPAFRGVLAMVVISSAICISVFSWLAIYSRYYG